MSKLLDTRRPPRTVPDQRYDRRIRLVYRTNNVLHGEGNLTGCPDGNITGYRWDVFVEVISAGKAVHELKHLNLVANGEDLVIPSQSLQPSKYMIQFQVTVRIPDNSTDVKVYSVAQTWIEVVAMPLVVTLGPSLVTRYADDDLWVSAEGSWDPEGLTDPSVWNYRWTCNQTHGGVVEDCATRELDSRRGVLYVVNSRPSMTTFTVTVVASSPGRGEVAASQTVVLHDNPACQLSITCTGNCDHTRLDPALPLQLQAVPGPDAAAMYQWSVVRSKDGSASLPNTVELTQETLHVEAGVLEAGESYTVRSVNRIQDCGNDIVESTWTFVVRPGVRLGNDVTNCTIHRVDTAGCVCCAEVNDELGPVTYKFRIAPPYEKDRGKVQFPPKTDFMIPRYCSDGIPEDDIIVGLWVSGTDGRLLVHANITEKSGDKVALPDDVIEKLSGAEMKDMGTIQDVATLVTLTSAKKLPLSSKVNQIVGAVYNTIDAIAETYDILMTNETQGATAIFEMPKLQLKVEKGGCQDEQRKILVVEDLVVVTPPFRNLSSGCGEDDAVGLVLTEANFNPFQYAGNSQEIRSEVVSMTVRVGREIRPVHNLTDPFDMIIRRDDRDVASTMFTHAGRIQSDSDIAVAEFRPQKSGTALSIYLDLEQTPEARDVRLLLRNESSGSIPENYDNVSLTTVLPVPQHQLFTLPSLYNGTEVNLTASPYSWLVLPEQGPIMDYQNTTNTSYFLYILHDTKNAISRVTVTSKFTVSILETACVYFGEESQQWQSDGCKVGPLSNTTHIHCQCDHLTKFAGFVPPNPLRFDKVFSASIADNPVGLIAVLAVFGLFVTGCLLARKADRADLQKVGVTIPAGLQLNSDTNKHYVITIYTGYRAGAGTTAQVSIVLFGFLDESEPLHLCDDRRVLFESGSEDSFLVSTDRRLGPLTHVHVWHNNAGFSPGWFLSRVVVKHVRSGRQDYFICNKWLALEEDDGRINRMIFVASPEEMASLSNLIIDRVSKDANDGHLYYSMIGRPARSSFTRVQRLTCCMCTVYCAMVTNITFFGQGDKFDPPEPVRFMGVEFQLPISLPEIMIGVQSAAMILPVTSAIVFLYRNASPRPPKASPKALTEPHVVYRGGRTSTTVSHQAPDIRPDDRQPVSTPSGSDPVRAGAVALPSGLTERRHAVRHLRQIPSETEPEAIELVIPEGSSGSSETDAYKEPKNGFKLPWWASRIAGALAWSASFVAAFFIVLYSLSFGRAKAEAWLVTFMTSFTTDLFLLQPVKLMAAAVGVVLVLRKPMNDDDLPPAATTDDEEYLDTVPQQIPSERKGTELPGNDVLAEDRARRLRKKKVRGALKETLLYGMFVCVLLLTSYGERSSLAYHMNQAVRGFVVDGSAGSAFSEISNVTSFWQWVDTTLIPATHSPPWYNRQASNHSLHLPDHMTHVIAPLRFRQVRTRQEQQCTIPDTMLSVSARCLDGFSVLNADTSNYNGSWDAPTKPNHTFTDDTTAQSPWHYAYGNIADGFARVGKHGTYDTGGYVATLNWTLDRSIEISTDLQTKNWLDDKTRAVFLEMTLYNPHANLFSAVVMVTEFSITGVVSTATEMTTFRLHHGDQVTLLVLRVAMALFVLYYLIKAVMNFSTRPLEYLTEAWSWLEIFIIFSASTTLGLYFRAQGVMDDITGHGQGDHVFESYHQAATWYQTYTYLLSFLICCSFIKLIRLLRFNNHVNALMYTMTKTAKPLFNFLIMASIILTAFALAANLTLGLNLKEYSTLLATYENLFSMMLGSFSFAKLEEGSAFFGPAMFVFFQCTVQFFLLTMFMSIIMDVYAESREVTNPDQVQFVQFLKDEMNEAVDKLGSFVKKQQDCQPDLEKNPRMTLLDQVQNAMAELEEENAMARAEEQKEKQRREKQQRERQQRARPAYFIGNDDV
ncbi:hypothetical protein Bbelb_382660 [Branchiostoma belcheri]|nr:hypothetical protein Bbelb_382660 [Branchiostoma belcheri]